MVHRRVPVLTGPISCVDIDLCHRLTDPSFTMSFEVVKPYVGRIIGSNLFFFFFFGVDFSFVRSPTSRHSQGKLTFTPVRDDSLHVLQRAEPATIV